MAVSLLLKVAGFAVLATLARAVYATYRARSKFRELGTKYGIEMVPGHSMIWGHLQFVGELMAAYPSDLNGQWMPWCVLQKYPHLRKQGGIYVDIWPISDPMFAIFDPNMMSQLCQDPSQPKHKLVKDEFYPITHMKDLVTSDGPEWKTWRAYFNPGFSVQNIMSLVPSFVEEAKVFKAYWDQIAETGETVELEDSLMKATCDIISRAVLGRSLHIQTTKSRLWAALKESVGYIVADNSPRGLKRWLSPYRPFIVPRNNRIMFDELKPYFEAEMAANSGVAASAIGKSGEPKTITSLAVRAWKKEAAASGPEEGAPAIDSDFLEGVVEQLKIFLFAGHDTTAVALGFTFYYLHKNPDCAVRIRAEHDLILGPDPATAGDQIAANPTILNQLTYTSAVIKEILRLCPPVSSVRAGAPDHFITHPRTGLRFPTDGFLNLSSALISHRDPDIWDEPDKFVPERWLSGKETVKNAYRPFELGPRGCIGQELGLTEMRMMLALTVREYDVIPMYPADAPTLLGEQAYQVDLPKEITSHVTGGFPAKVVRRKFEPTVRS